MELWPLQGGIWLRKIMWTKAQSWDAHALASWCFMQSKVENKLLCRCFLTAMAWVMRQNVRNKNAKHEIEFNPRNTTPKQNKNYTRPWVISNTYQELCFLYDAIDFVRSSFFGSINRAVIYLLPFFFVSCLAWENQFYFAINRFDLKEFIEKPHSTWLQTHTNLHTQANSFIAVEAQIKRIFWLSCWVT